MATLTEGMHEGEFIGELALGIGYHVDAITLKSGEDLVAGAVLAATETAAPTVTPGTPVAGAGGTIGNGTVGSWTADAGAQEGTWLLICTATGATGKFRVMRPDGTLDGILTIGSAYNGGINGTIADGSNDWLVDDIIPMVVAHAAGDSVIKYVEYDPAGTGGAEIPAAILMKTTDASGGDVATTALVRGPGVVNGNDLSWITGITADEKAVAKAALLANTGIKVA